jgi:hypothetical protein
MIGELFMFKKLLPLLFLFAGFQANAALISSSVWHDTAGPVGGLLQSEFDDSIFYAQAGIFTFSYADTYSALDGYHFASAVEYRGLWDASVLLNGTPSYRSLHYGQGGWSNYTNNSGVTDRRYFAFSDIFNGVRETRDIVHAGNGELHAALYQGINYESGFNQCGGCSFGGFILIEDEATVPEPSIIALFGLGLVGIGFARRKRQS